jgi:hypothetical protein
MSRSACAQVLSLHTPVAYRELDALDFTAHLGLIMPAPDGTWLHPPLAGLLAQWMPPRAVNAAAPSSFASHGVSAWGQACSARGMCGVGDEDAGGARVQVLEETEYTAEGERLSDGLLLLWPRGPLILGSSPVCACVRARCCRARMFALLSNGLRLRASEIYTAASETRRRWICASLRGQSPTN